MAKEERISLHNGDSALGEGLADDIQRRIFSGDLAVGSWLRHGALAEEYGISRTPVREALLILQARGSVVIERNRGAQVRTPSARAMRELADVIAELEGYGAALAAERIRDDQLDRLDDAWRGYRDAIEAYVERPSDPKREELGSRWFEANARFHSEITEAAGNRQLKMVLEDVDRKFPAGLTYTPLSGDSRLLLQNADEHDQIASAIRSHDPVAAREAMSGHIRTAGRLVARWFEDEFERES
jgi:DNA-binding GntR family transcriptional regulator